MLKNIIIIVMLCISCTASAFDVVTFEARVNAHENDVWLRCWTTLENKQTRVATFAPGVKVVVFNKNMNDGDWIKCNAVGAKKTPDGKWLVSTPSEMVQMTYIAAQFKAPDSPTGVIYIPIGVK